MTHYLVTIHRPDGYDPDTAEDGVLRRDIALVNQEMIVAGVRLFVGGLQPPASAWSIQAVPGATATAGPYLKTGEHVGGLWVLDVDTLEEALDWGRKAALACRAPVEVRPFH